MCEFLGAGWLAQAWLGLRAPSRVLFPGPGLSLGAGGIPGQGCSKSRPPGVLGLSQEPGREGGRGEGSASLLLRGETEALGRFLLKEPLCEIQEKPFLTQPLQLSGASPGKSGRVMFTPSPPPSRCGRSRKDSGQMLGVQRPGELPGGGGGHDWSSVVESEV